MKNYDDAIAAYKEGMKQCPKDDLLTRGLADTQRAKIASTKSGQQASQAARKTQASLRASLSRKDKANMSKGASAFVVESRKAIKQDIAMLQAQLELLDSLAEMTDEEKMALLFMTLDVDGDGLISATELSNAVRKRHADMDMVESLDRAMSLVAAFDEDGDAKLNAEEFKVLVDAFAADMEGTSFHELAEYLILQSIMLPGNSIVEQVIVDTVAGEDIDKEVKARGDLMSALVDPRLIQLFLLFDKTGDGELSFKEVAIGLYQLTDDMETAVKSTVELLLALDHDDSRTLDYKEFAHLILGFCAAAEKSFNDMADDLTLALSSDEIAMTEEDLAGLYISDEYYQSAKDLVDAMKEEVKVEDVLGYGRLLKLFALLDENHDGGLDANELAKGLQKFHTAMGMESNAGLEAAMLVLVSDDDGDAVLDKTEFARAMVKYADANEVGVHDLVDFMCVTSLADGDDYGVAVTQSISGGIPDISVAEAEIH